MRSGGEADKLANAYEGRWTTRQLFDVLDGKALSIEIEPLVDGQGVVALHSGKVYHQDMNQLSRFVSLHPYFKVPPDKMPYLKAILPEFAAKTLNETDNLSTSSRSTATKYSAAKATSTPKRCWRTWKTWVRC